MAANRAATVAATKEATVAAMAVANREAMEEVKEATRAANRAAMEAATVPKEDRAAMAAATKEEDKVTEEVIREDIREDNKVIMEEGVREVIMEMEDMEMMVDMEMEEDTVEATRVTEVVIRAATVVDKEVTSRVDNKAVTRPQLRLAGQHLLLLPHRPVVQEEEVDRTTEELHLHRVDKEDTTAAVEDRVVTLAVVEVEDRATTTPEVVVEEGDRDTVVNELLFEHTDHGTRSNNHDHEVMKPC